MVLGVYDTMKRSRKPKGSRRDPSKKCDRELEWCESCECGVPKDKASIDMHFSSDPHKRKEALHTMASFFARHGLDYFPAGASSWWNSGRLRRGHGVVALDSVVCVRGLRCRTVLSRDFAVSRCRDVVVVRRVAEM